MAAALPNLITVWPLALSTCTELCTVQPPSNTATRSSAAGSFCRPLSQAKPISLALPNGIEIGVTASAPLTRVPVCTSSSCLAGWAGLANFFSAAVSPLNTSWSTSVVAYW